MLLISFLQGSYDHYCELKNTYDSEAWRSVYPAILEKYKVDSYINEFTYPQILIEEGDMQRLLEFVQDRPSRIVDYYKNLLTTFKDEVYAIFNHYIEQSAAASSNRNEYKKVCAVIRKLKKAGGREAAEAITQKLYTQYALRPAFRDELSRV